MSLLPLALALTPDLHQELALARELQDLRVLVAAAAEPHVVLVVHVDAVLELRPLVAGAGPAPRRHERAVGVELEHRRRRLPDRSRFVRLQRRRAMRDPDVIARVDRDAGDRADNPAVRQRLRPQRIDAILGRGRFFIGVMAIASNTETGKPAHRFNMSWIAREGDVFNPAGQRSGTPVVPASRAGSRRVRGYGRLLIGISVLTPKVYAL